MMNTQHGYKIMTKILTKADNIFQFPPKKVLFHWEELFESCCSYDTVGGGISRTDSASAANFSNT